MMRIRHTQKHDCSTCKHIEDSWVCSLCGVIVYSQEAAIEHDMYHANRGEGMTIQNFRT